MIGDYAGGNKGERSKGTRTCLQMRFAVYATFVVVLLLLHYMSLQFGVKPELAWPRGKRLLSLAEGCDNEMTNINLEQQKPQDEVTVRLKRELYNEVLAFQQSSFGAETLPELLRMPSRWSFPSKSAPRVTVILNHFKRRTLCAQLEQLRRQTLPFHRVWVLSFGSPNEASLRRVVESRHNDSRISFVSSDYNFRYYGRFQMALQSDSDYVYILDDDMIPGTRMLEILCHVAGTDKYANAVLGSIGRILPFRRNDGTFPSYRTLFRSKEAGLYLPYQAYNIVAERVVQVDFLCSSWFLPSDLVKTLFIETPTTFTTGEDLHLSYMLQKYMGVGSFVLPVDAADNSTWGDTDHRLAYVSPTTSTSKDMVRARDKQWWRALTSGYVTQWAAMHPQKVDALLYAHTLGEVRELAPLLHKFRATQRREAYLVVSGRCEEAAALLKWPKAVCTERRFNIFDLSVNGKVPVLQAVYAGMRGMVRMLNPSVVVSLADIDGEVKEALRMAADNCTALVLLPRRSVSKVLWMATLDPASLPSWNRMRISVNIIITQNRTAMSVQRLLTSLLNAYYLGDEVSVSFDMDITRVDARTIKLVSSFHWPHGSKTLCQSWYPSSDDDYGILLEDDAEVSPHFYLWVKYALLAYRYDPAAVTSLPELVSISLYTPPFVKFFDKTKFNTPYLHQLPCSWGAVFFPTHWREFHAYMSTRFTEEDVQKKSANGLHESWKRFLIDMMYQRGYVTLYPNFPNRTSFSTHHMENSEHHNSSTEFEVPLMDNDFSSLLPMGKMPPTSQLPVLNLFKQDVSMEGLKAARTKLRQNVINCRPGEIVAVDHITGSPMNCTPF